MNFKAIYLTCSLILISSTASALELCGEPIQGEIIFGRAENAEKILFNNNKIPLSDNGDFLIAFSRDDKLSHTIAVKSSDNKQELPLKINTQKWDIQNIKGLPQKKVTPSKEDQKSIDRERNDIRGAQKDITMQELWKSGFIKPVEGRISGKFGGQRIMNGEKRNPHMGLDIAAPEGTDIKSSSDGIIALAGKDYFYSGNVVVINHGHGLFTIYAHMKDISVKKGDKIKQGDVIGTVGKTGRATGPHLHWGASLNGTRFDPSSLLKMNNRNLCFTL